MAGGGYSPFNKIRIIEEPNENTTSNQVLVRKTDGDPLTEVGQVEYADISSLSDDKIPLAGTEPGAPITGDLEFDNSGFDNVKGFKAWDEGEGEYIVIGFFNDSNDDYVKLGRLNDQMSKGVSFNGFNSKGIGFYSQDKITDQKTFFNVFPNEVSVNSDNQDFKGIVGSQVFDKQGDPAAYLQLDDIVGLGAGTVTSVTGVADQITVANGTTTPVIGISSVFANSKANLSGGNSFTGIQNFANDIKLPVNSSVVLGDKFRWVYRSDLNGFSLTTEDVETGTLFIKDTDAKIGLHNTNPQSALDVVGSIRSSENDGNPNTNTRNDDVVLRGGTVAGKPITGKLVFEDIGAPQLESLGADILLKTGMYLLDNSIQFLRTEDNYETTESIQFDYRGLIGGKLFNKQNDPNTYAQIGDVNNGIVTSDAVLTFATNELRQNHFVTFNGTASTLNLPLASENAWKCVTVWNKGTSDVTVNAGTNEIWEGGIEMSSTTISVDSNTKFVSDGLNWNIQ